MCRAVPVASLFTPSVCLLWSDCMTGLWKTGTLVFSLARVFVVVCVVFYFYFSVSLFSAAAHDECCAFVVSGISMDSVWLCYPVGGSNVVVVQQRPQHLFIPSSISLQWPFSFCTLSSAFTNQDSFSIPPSHGFFCPFPSSSDIHFSFFLTHHCAPPLCVCPLRWTPWITSPTPTLHPEKTTQSLTSSPARALPPWPATWSPQRSEVPDPSYNPILSLSRPGTQTCCFEVTYFVLRLDQNVALVPGLSPTGRNSVVLATKTKKLHRNTFRGIFQTLWSISASVTTAAIMEKCKKSN